MVHDEPWQVFHSNGSPIEGAAAKRTDFSADMVMGRHTFGCGELVTMGSLK